MELTKGICFLCSNKKVLSDHNGKIFKKIKSLFTDSSINKKELNSITPLKVCPVCYHKINILKFNEDVDSDFDNCLLCGNDRDIIRVTNWNFFDEISGDFSSLTKTRIIKICPSCIFYLDIRNLIKKKLISKYPQLKKGTFRPRSKFELNIKDHSTPIPPRKLRKCREPICVDLTEDDENESVLSYLKLKPLKQEKKIKFNNSVLEDDKLMNQVLIIKFNPLENKESNEVIILDSVEKTLKTKKGTLRKFKAAQNKKAVEDDNDKEIIKEKSKRRTIIDNNDTDTDDKDSDKEIMKEKSKKRRVEESDNDTYHENFFKNLETKIIDNDIIKEKSKMRKFEESDDDTDSNSLQTNGIDNEKSNEDVVKKKLNIKLPARKFRAAQKKILKDINKNVPDDKVVKKKLRRRIVENNEDSDEVTIDVVKKKLRKKPGKKGKFKAAKNRIPLRKETENSDDDTNDKIKNIDNEITYEISKMSIIENNEDSDESTIIQKKLKSRKETGKKFKSTQNKNATSDEDTDNKSSDNEIIIEKSKKGIIENNEESDEVDSVKKKLKNKNDTSSDENTDDESVKSIEKSKNKITENNEESDDSVKKKLKNKNDTSSDENTDDESLKSIEKSKMKITENNEESDEVHSGQKKLKSTPQKKIKSAQNKNNTSSDEDTDDDSVKIIDKEKSKKGITENNEDSDEVDSDQKKVKNTPTKKFKSAQNKNNTSSDEDTDDESVKSLDKEKSKQGITENNEESDEVDSDQKKVKNTPTKKFKSAQNKNHTSSDEDTDDDSVKSIDKEKSKKGITENNEESDEVDSVKKKLRKKPAKKGNVRKFKSAQNKVLKDINKNVPSTEDTDISD